MLEFYIFLFIPSAFGYNISVNQNRKFLFGDVLEPLCSIDLSGSVLDRNETIRLFHEWEQFSANAIESIKPNASPQDYREGMPCFPGPEMNIGTTQDSLPTYPSCSTLINTTLLVMNEAEDYLDLINNATNTNGSESSSDNDNLRYSLMDRVKNLKEYIPDGVTRNNITKHVDKLCNFTRSKPVQHDSQNSDLPGVCNYLKLENYDSLSSDLKSRPIGKILCELESICDYTSFESMIVPCLTKLNYGINMTEAIYNTISNMTVDQLIPFLMSSRRAPAMISYPKLSFSKRRDRSSSSKYWTDLFSTSSPRRGKRTVEPSQQPSSLAGTTDKTGTETTEQSTGLIGTSEAIGTTSGAFGITTEDHSAKNTTSTVTPHREHGRHTKSISSSSHQGIMKNENISDAEMEKKSAENNETILEIIEYLAGNNGSLEHISNLINQSLPERQHHRGLCDKGHMDGEFIERLINISMTDIDSDIAHKLDVEDIARKIESMDQKLLQKICYLLISGKYEQPTGEHQNNETESTHNVSKTPDHPPRENQSRDQFKKDDDGLAERIVEAILASNQTSDDFYHNQTELNTSDHPPRKNNHSEHSSSHNSIWEILNNSSSTSDDLLKNPSILQLLPASLLETMKTSNLTVAEIQKKIMENNGEIIEKLPTSLTKEDQDAANSTTDNNVSNKENHQASSNILNNILQSSAFTKLLPASILGLIKNGGLTTSEVEKRITEHNGTISAIIDFLKGDNGSLEHMIDQASHEEKEKHHQGFCDNFDKDKVDGDFIEHLINISVTLPNIGQILNMDVEDIARKIESMDNKMLQKICYLLTDEEKFEGSHNNETELTAEELHGTLKTSDHSHRDNNSIETEHDEVARKIIEELLSNKPSSNEASIWENLNSSNLTLDDLLKDPTIVQLLPASLLETIKKSNLTGSEIRNKIMENNETMEEIMGNFTVEDTSDNKLSNNKTSVLEKLLQTPALTKLLPSSILDMIKNGMPPTSDDGKRLMESNDLNENNRSLEQTSTMINHLLPGEKHNQGLCDNFNKTTVDDKLLQNLIKMSATLPNIEQKLNMSVEDIASKVKSMDNTVLQKICYLSLNAAENPSKENHQSAVTVLKNLAVNNQSSNISSILEALNNSNLTAENVLQNSSLINLLPSSLLDIMNNGNLSVADIQTKLQDSNGTFTDLVDKLNSSLTKDNHGAFSEGHLANNQSSNISSILEILNNSNWTSEQILQNSTIINMLPASLINVLKRGNLSVADIQTKLQDNNGTLANIMEKLNSSSTKDNHGAFSETHLANNRSNNISSVLEALKNSNLTSENILQNSSLIDMLPASVIEAMKKGNLSVADIQTKLQNSNGTLADIVAKLNSSSPKDNHGQFSEGHLANNQSSNISSILEALNNLNLTSEQILQNSTITNMLPASLIDAVKRGNLSVADIQTKLQNSNGTLPDIVAKLNSSSPKDNHGPFSEAHLANSQSNNISSILEVLKNSNLTSESILQNSSIISMLPSSLLDIMKNGNLSVADIQTKLQNSNGTLADIVAKLNSSSLKENHGQFSKANIANNQSSNISSVLEFMKNSNLTSENILQNSSLTNMLPASLIDAVKRGNLSVTDIQTKLQNSNGTLADIVAKLNSSLTKDNHGSFLEGHLANNQSSNISSLLETLKNSSSTSENILQNSSLMNLLPSSLIDRMKSDNLSISEIKKKLQDNNGTLADFVQQLNSSSTKDNHGPFSEGHLFNNHSSNISSILEILKDSNLTSEQILQNSSIINMLPASLMDAVKKGNLSVAEIRTQLQSSNETFTDFVGNLNSSSPKGIHGTTSETHSANNQSNNITSLLGTLNNSNLTSEQVLQNSSLMNLLPSSLLNIMKNGNLSVADIQTKLQDNNGTLTDIVQNLELSNSTLPQIPNLNQLFPNSRLETSKGSTSTHLDPQSSDLSSTQNSLKSTDGVSTITQHLEKKNSSSSDMNGSPSPNAVPNSNETFKTESNEMKTTQSASSFEEVSTALPTDQSHPEFDKELCDYFDSDNQDLIFPLLNIYIPNILQKLNMSESDYTSKFEIIDTELLQKICYISLSEPPTKENEKRVREIAEALQEIKKSKRTTSSSSGDVFYSTTMIRTAEVAKLITEMLNSTGICSKNTTREKKDESINDVLKQLNISETDQLQLVEKLNGEANIVDKICDGSIDDYLKNGNFVSQYQSINQILEKNNLTISDIVAQIKGTNGSLESISQMVNQSFPNLELNKNLCDKLDKTDFNSDIVKLWMNMSVSIPNITQLLNMNAVDIASKVQSLDLEILKKICYLSFSDSVTNKNSGTVAAIAEALQAIDKSNNTASNSSLVDQPMDKLLGTLNNATNISSSALLETANATQIKQLLTTNNQTSSDQKAIISQIASSVNLTNASPSDLLANLSNSKQATDMMSKMGISSASDLSKLFG